MKAVIFDFDGTLADTLLICFHAFQAVFREFDHIDLTDEEIKEMFGPSETGIINENLVNENRGKAIERYYEMYRQNHHDFVSDNEDINNLLIHLKNEGYKLAIVTGKGRMSLDISLECLKINDLFDVIITGDDVNVPKPHPEGIYKALNQLNIENDEAVFLGDSDADILAGKAADVFTIGVQWLQNYHSHEFNEKPDQIFKSIHDCKRFIDQTWILS